MIDDDPFAYLSALHAVQELLPMHGSGIETGIGTGPVCIAARDQAGDRTVAIHGGDFGEGSFVVIKADK